MFTRYKIIRSFKELKQLVEACLHTGYASVDFETNAEGIYKDTFKPTILSVSFQVGSGCSIPLQHFDESVQDIPWLKWLRYFGRKVVENPKIVKVAQNFKFDNQIFVKYGIYVRGTVIDTMLAKYLLNEEKPHGLKPMVAKYLPEFADYEKYDKFESIDWDKKPLEPLARYGCMDTDFTLRLGLFLEKKLIDKGFYNLYRNLIMPASKVLQDAETNGLPIDLQFNDQLQDKYSKLIQETNDKLRSVRQIKRYQKYSLEQRKRDYIDKLTQEIEELSRDPKKARSVKNREDKISRVLAGEYQTNDEKKLIEPVNFNSTKQMVDLLYISPKGFKFPIVEYTKDKKNKPTNNPSTSEGTLTKILDQDESGFIKALLDLRGLDKMNSTYIVGLRELVQSDNKVHPTFLIHGTTSGRLSSKNPNGQNIPKVMVNPDIKKQFIPPPGKLFLAYDYSQAELRILAHLAKEETMLEWFRTGKDIHLASACKKYHENYDEILKIYEDEQHELYPLWKKRRKQAKTINFGIVYEQSAHKLAESLSTPEEKVDDSEGQQFLDEYFTTFPKIKKFMDKQHKFMEKHGYCVSLFGRRRRCPNVYSDNFSEYLEALRQCVDGETEVLTTTGWRRYNQLINGNLILTKNPDNGILEWQPVEKVNIYPDYEGDLYSIEGKTFSALTNGKHRWLCNHNSKSDSSYEFLTSEELYNSRIVRPIHRTGEYKGSRTKVLDNNLVYLLGLILTDGHIRYYRDKSKPRYGKPWYVVITQSKKRNIPIIQGLIDKLPDKYSYTHKIYNGNKHVWKFNKGFADYIDTLIPNKKLTMPLLMSLTKSQIKLLLDGMILGDGCKHGTRILTSNLEQANLIQILIIMAGYYSNILVNNNIGIHISDKVKSGKIITKNISYLVTIGKSKYFHTRSTRGKNHITKLINQKKLIWCPTVKNGTWVCRRNGKTYITGNSTNMPCQSAASDMALFASIIVWEKVKKGELPPMREVNTVHDSVYQFIEPRYITPDTIYRIWDICRNPSTKEFFDFEIKDVDMSMDFTIGRTMAEELPYIPGYDYNKMLSGDFDIDEYYNQHKKVKGIAISDYPKKFKSYFEESWRKR